MVFENYGPYAASKSGVIRLTKVASVEYAAKRIRVNAVAPGAILTPLFQDVIEKTSCITRGLRESNPNENAAQKRKKSQPP